MNRLPGLFADFLENLFGLAEPKRTARPASAPPPKRQDTASMGKMRQDAAPRTTPESQRKRPNAASTGTNQQDAAPRTTPESRRTRPNAGPKGNAPSSTRAPTVRPSSTPTLLQPQHLLNTTNPDLAATLWHAYLHRSYMPRPLHFRTIQTGGKPRRVGIPHPTDAALMRAWRTALDPRVDPHLCSHVWGYRSGRSREAAVHTVLGPLPPNPVLVRTDIRRMFESIPLQLMRDTRHMYHGDWWLVERWLLAWCPDGGLPTGANISPLLSNLAMHFACDTSLRNTSKFIRYSDDFSIVLGVAEAEPWLTRLRGLLHRHHLALHPEKTFILPLTDGTRTSVLGVPLRVQGRQLVSG